MSISGCHLIHKSHVARIRNDTENSASAVKSLHLASEKSLPKRLFIMDTNEQVDPHRKIHTVKLRMPRGNSNAYECSAESPVIANICTTINPIITVRLKIRIPMYVKRSKVLFL